MPRDRWGRAIGVLRPPLACLACMQIVFPAGPGRDQPLPETLHLTSLRLFDLMLCYDTFAAPAIIYSTHISLIAVL